MRCIRLTGREVSVVKAIGFHDTVIGAEIQDHTQMQPDDITDTLNGLISAGFVESIPYSAEVGMAEMPVTVFEVNPAYVHELKSAMLLP